MIFNQWYAVIEARKVSRKKPLGIKRFGRKLVLWRDRDGSLNCLPDVCSHRRAELSRGRLRDDCIECPYHGLVFDGGGECRSIPANGREARVPRAFNMETLPVREAHGLIWVWHGEARSVYPELPWFDIPELSPGKYSRELSREVPVHYARYVEASIDIHHASVLHRRVLPGIGAYVPDYEARMEGDVIYSSGTLMHEPPSQSKRALRLEINVRMPGVIHLKLSEKVSGMALPVPIDENNTWIFVRFAQNVIRLPLLGKLASWLALMADWELTQKLDDLPTMLSQEPAIPSSADYRLFHADKAIGLYLKRREELLREQGARQSA